MALREQCQEVVKMQTTNGTTPGNNQQQKLQKLQTQPQQAYSNLSYQHDVSQLPTLLTYAPLPRVPTTPSTPLLDYN